MKKVFVLLLALCLTLCACGGNDDTVPPAEEVVSPVQVESPKGSRENPYYVGETIVINEMYPADTHPEKETPFRMKLVVTNSYTPEQSGDNRMNRMFPVAELSISFSGEYEGQMNLDEFFYRPLLTTELEKEWPQVFTSDGSMRELTALETGEEYDLLVAIYQEDINAPRKEYPYLMITYFSADNTVNDIYIDLSGKQSEMTAEEVSELSAEEQERYYQAAFAAEKKGYYTVAKNLYEDIPGYKDANVRCQAMLDALAPYNGTYYGDSHQHEGVSVWLYMQDGAVWATYDVENTPVLEYELFQPGMDSEGEPVMEFSSGLTRFFVDNQNASYAPGFFVTEDSQNWIVTAVEGNQDKSWNCTLEKISDTVDEQLLQ